MANVYPLPTPDQGFEYEVAFSFLEQDEPMARQLSDLLQERLSTFVYSERQREVAGTDGVETFTAVFQERARTVVILHRKGWARRNGPASR